MSVIDSKLKAIENAQDDLRKYLIDSISQIKQNSEIKEVSGNCFSLSFSTLSNNNCVLSPSYYNFETQINIVKKHIDSSADCGLKYIRRIIESGCDRHEDIFFHPEFLKQLSSIIEK